MIDGEHRNGVGRESAFTGERAEKNGDSEMVVVMWGRR